MKHPNILSAIALIGFTILSACNNNTCDKLTNEVNNMSNDAFGKLPYTGTDTLCFVDELNDTSLVVGQGKNLFYEETSKPVTPVCFHKILDQAFKISYKPIKGNLAFDVYQKANGKNIVLTVPTFPVHYYIDYLTVGTYSHLNLDSANVAGVWYKNVSTATAKDVTFNIIDDTYTCHYNQPYGVLLIKSKKENKTYSLIGGKWLSWVYNI